MQLEYNTVILKARIKQCSADAAVIQNSGALLKYYSPATQTLMIIFTVWVETSKQGGSHSYTCAHVRRHVAAASKAGNYVQHPIHPTPNRVDVKLGPWHSAWMTSGRLEYIAVIILRARIKQCGGDAAVTRNSGALHK